MAGVFENQRLTAVLNEIISGPGASLSVAVVDRGGYLLAVVRGQAAAPLTPDLAIAKAYTAVMWSMATEDLGPIVEALPEFGATARHIGLRTQCLAAGGVPVMGDDGCLAAVGVSGGDDDATSASILADRLKELLDP